MFSLMSGCCVQCFRFFIAAILLLLLSPIILLSMFLIWIDSGPGVVFKQTRIGKGLKPFTIYKLRTMYSGVDVSRDILFSNKKARTTRVGLILRVLKIDESLQLLNILKGDMNFFGPRPLREEIHHHCMNQIPGFEARYKVRPGIMGLSQIFSFTEIDRIYLACDLYYVDHESLTLNAMIAVVTLLYIAQSFLHEIYVCIRAYWFRRVGMYASKTLSVSCGQRQESKVERS